jgi:hypothetical protein
LVPRESLPLEGVVKFSRPARDVVGSLLGAMWASEGREGSCAVGCADLRQAIHQLHFGIGSPAEDDAEDALVDWTGRDLAEIVRGAERVSATDAGRACGAGTFELADVGADAEVGVAAMAGEARELGVLNEAERAARWAAEHGYGPTLRRLQQQQTRGRRGQPRRGRAAAAEEAAGADLGLI